MHGVVLNSGRGEVYATFGTFAEAQAFIARGKAPTPAAVVRNPYGDRRDPMGDPAPARAILTGPHKGE